MSIPHGGELIRRILSEDEAASVIASAGDLPKITLEEASVKDVFNICNGVYSPLEGFVGRDDYRSILDSMHLTSGPAWTFPIVLDTDKDTAASLADGTDILLTDESDAPVAVMHLSGKYDYDRQEMAQKVYLTNDTRHPGVEKTMAMKDVLLAGTLDLVHDPALPFPDVTLSPVETRMMFKKKGWDTVVGFQTRNVPHVGHEYVQKWALTVSDGVFINPVIGRKKQGDFLDQVILDSYRALLENYYPADRAFMSVLHFEMRYAGPREAIFHAIARKNFGCTHFIVGRDHAGVGDYYEPFAAQDIFKDFPDLGITPVFFKSFFHCRKCGGVSNEKTCPHGEEHIINFSGTKMRELLTSGQVPPPEMMREEVAKAVIDHDKIFVE